MSKPPTAEDRLKDCIAEYSPAIAKRGRAILEAMRALVPGMTEVVYDYRKNLLVSFSPTGKGYKASFTIVFYPTKVDLAFLHGATLADPQRVLQGRGKQVRSLELRSTMDLMRADVRALVDQELALAPSWDKGRPREVVVRAQAADREPGRP